MDGWKLYVILQTQQSSICASWSVRCLPCVSLCLDKPRSKLMFQSFLCPQDCHPPDFAKPPSRTWKLKQKHQHWVKIHENQQNLVSRFIYLHMSYQLTAGIDPWAHPGDCKMHGVKLTISPRGGIILWVKVSWLNFSQLLSMIQQKCMHIPPPHLIDSDTISWSSPFPGAKNPFHPLTFPDISPLGPGVHPWGKPMTCNTMYMQYTNMITQTKM